MILSITYASYDQWTYWSYGVASYGPAWICKFLTFPCAALFLPFSWNHSMFNTTKQSNSFLSILDGSSRLFCYPLTAFFMKNPFPRPSIRHYASPNSYLLTNHSILAIASCRGRGKSSTVLKTLITPDCLCRGPPLITDSQSTPPTPR